MAPRRDRLARLEAALRAACDPRRARFLGTYFGDARPRFVGLTAVAAQRVARAHAADFDVAGAFELLGSSIRELRYVALVMLARAAARGGRATRETIARGYLRALDRVDHWVLVDVSAP